LGLEGTNNGDGYLKIGLFSIVVKGWGNLSWEVHILKGLDDQLLFIRVEREKNTE
jgi:hypothetical protein